MKKIRVAPLTELEPGRGRCVSYGESRIAVFRTGEGVYAVDDQCPHRGGPLSEGDVMGDQIVCPWHFWAFDLKTGRHHASEGRFRVATYETIVEEGIVYLMLPEGETSESKTVEACRSQE